MMQKILILGTGDYASVAAEVIHETPGFQVVGFVENLDRARCQIRIEGLPVYWLEEAGALAGECKAVCSLATVRRRGYIEQASAMGFGFATVIHPSARVPASARLGDGCFLEPGVILSTRTELGAHVRVNRGVTVGHDTLIGDYCTLQPGVNIAGRCRLGDGVYVGIGATVVDHISIGQLSVIGAGAVVLTDLPERVLAVGIPARAVKTNIEGK
jgi:sugar O-acyltransferase (sialic acid O-acetyltransferase NeuD family)